MSEKKTIRLKATAMYKGVSSTATVNITPYTVTNAYFAAMSEQDVYDIKQSTKNHTAKSGDYLNKIANTLGVSLAELKTQNKLKSNTVKIGQKFSVTVKEKTKKGKNITFTPLNKASVGDEVYIVIETKDLQGKTIKTKIHQGKEKVLAEVDNAISVMHNAKEKFEFSAKVGEFANKNNALNKEYLKNIAVVKITLAPKNDQDIKKWNNAIKKLTTKTTYLYLYVEADISEKVKYKGGKGTNKDEKQFCNADGKWLALSENAMKNGYYYNEDGAFEGKVDEETREGFAQDVYICKGKEVKKNGKIEEVIAYNKPKQLKEGQNNMTHDDFCQIAYIVQHEADPINTQLEELKCIAFASYNYAKVRKKTWRGLLSTAYSSVSNKIPLSENKNKTRDKLTRIALFSVLQGDNDITKGAEFWDGTDFLAWGNTETNPWNKLGSNKFDEYKFIEIPKDIYEDYLAANGSSTRYKDKGNHPKTGDKGTHIHVEKKVKQKVVDANGNPVLDKNKKPTYKDVNTPHKIKYTIPAADFTNSNYWKSGSFYYDTGVKTTYGISATISTGKSIFWKRTTKRLTSDKSIKKNETQEK